MRKFAVTQNWWIAPTSFLLLLVAYHFIFGQFFPTLSGTLGYDYSRVLPDLLDGYFWFRSNGLLEPFWFTPAFCGGQPSLADPAFIYYSTAQLLTLFINPVTGIYVSVLLFASLGFWGFYLLLRSCFGTSHQAAILGGALFMFNGFFIQRMLIGHFIYHGMMLLPLTAWFLLRPTTKNNILGVLSNGAAAGCMLAYGIYSGLVSLLLPCVAAIMAIICIHRLAGREHAGFMKRSLVATLVFSGLSASKLVATLSFLHYFPRSDYSLGGVASAWDAARLLFSALFFAPADIAEQAQPLLANVQWPLFRHEWEYGVTVVPLLIVLAGMAATLKHLRSARLRLPAASWAWLALLVFTLALPFALNIYTPDWNAFLKQVPLIKSSSTLVRWFLVYIPAIVLASALFMDRISPLESRRNGMLAAALAVLVAINALKDQDYYHSQEYPPDTIVTAWQNARAGAALPHIRQVGTMVDAYNQIQKPINRNDLIAYGVSQLVCYNAVFGYRLEYLPVGTLRPGRVLAETDGLLNIKNPACYTYPEQNNCVPGDHFAATQREAAQTFASYKPYPFRFSPAQQAANRITLATLVLLGILLAVLLSKVCRARLRPAA